MVIWHHSYVSWMCDGTAIFRLQFRCCIYCCCNGGLFRCPEFLPLSVPPIRYFVDKRIRWSWGESGFEEPNEQNGHNSRYPYVLKKYLHIPVQRNEILNSFWREASKITFPNVTHKSGDILSAVSEFDVHNMSRLSIVLFFHIHYSSISLHRPDQIQGHVLISVNPDECSLRAATELILKKKTTLLFFFMIPTVEEHVLNAKEVLALIKVRRNHILLILRLLD